MLQLNYCVHTFHVAPCTAGLSCTVHSAAPCKASDHSFSHSFIRTSTLQSHISRSGTASHVKMIVFLLPRNSYCKSPIHQRPLEAIVQSFITLGHSPLSSDAQLTSHEQCRVVHQRTEPRKNISDELYDVVILTEDRCILSSAVVNLFSDVNEFSSSWTNFCNVWTVLLLDVLCFSVSRIFLKHNTTPVSCLTRRSRWKYSKMRTKALFSANSMRHIDYAEYNTAAAAIFNVLDIIKHINTVANMTKEGCRVCWI